MNGFLSPFIALEASVVFWRTWQEQLTEHKNHLEAELQKAILTSGGSADNERVLARISRMSTAIRAFLDRNQGLTSLSGNPAIRMQELALLREWILAYQTTERELIHTMHISFGEWRRDGSYRDELGALAGSNDTVYRAIALIGALPYSFHKPIAQQLCGQLTEEHNRQHQME